MFDVLPNNLKSLAIRTKVRYAPHPYVWISKAKSKSTGLGIEDDGLEMKYEDLPAWNEEKIQVLPAVSTVSYSGGTDRADNRCNTVGSSGKTQSRVVCIYKSILRVPMALLSSHFRLARNEKELCTLTVERSMISKKSERCYTNFRDRVSLPRYVSFFFLR